ncbi:MAG: hypothetical protein [Microvirus sp.]|nr:MAG: hypothetical protein [Microvirus sp.]
MATNSAIPLSDDERRVIVTALSMLSKSMLRSANAAMSPEISELHKRDASRVDALASRFR